MWWPLNQDEQQHLFGWIRVANQSNARRTCGASDSAPAPDSPSPWIAARRERMNAFTSARNKGQPPARPTACACGFKTLLRGARICFSVILLSVADAPGRLLRMWMPSALIFSCLSVAPKFAQQATLWTSSDREQPFGASYHVFATQMPAPSSQGEERGQGEAVASW